MYTEQILELLICKCKCRYGLHSTKLHEISSCSSQDGPCWMTSQYIYRASNDTFCARKSRATTGNIRNLQRAAVVQCLLLLHILPTPEWWYSPCCTTKQIKRAVSTTLLRFLFPACRFNKNTGSHLQQNVFRNRSRWLSVGGMCAIVVCHETTRSLYKRAPASVSCHSHYTHLTGCRMLRRHGEALPT